jgi:hypothetical protein
MAAPGQNNRNEATVQSLTSCLMGKEAGGPDDLPGRPEAAKKQGWLSGVIPQKMGVHD